MKKIPVLLADDHTVVREGLRALLAIDNELEVVAEAENGHQAVTLCRETKPEVVVMDLALPSLNGLEAIRQILRLTPSVKVLVLSSYSDADSIRKALEAGASGYLLKQSAAEDLVRAIREVRRGNGFFSAAVARQLRDEQRLRQQTGKTAEEAARLTEKEQEVLGLVSDGLSNQEIASKVGRSIKTVEKHRQSVMNKLNIHEVAGLTRYAIAKGIGGKRDEQSEAA